MKSSFKRLLLIIALLVIGTVLLVTSKKEVPLEVAQVEKQLPNLQRLDAAIYTPEEYHHFLTAYQHALTRLHKENQKWVWFRRYTPVASDFKQLLRTSFDLHQKIIQEKKKTAAFLCKNYQDLTTSAATLNQMTSKMNEGRLARKDLIRAEILLENLKQLYDKEDYQGAKKLLEPIRNHLQQGVKALNQVLFRYKNPAQIEKWIHWIAETTAESRRTHGIAIIVNKIDRQLILYKNGRPIKTYTVGLGRNGLNSKLHAGDNATPEGRYRVLKKNPYSLYYKALLLDYPNKEDRLQFQLARKNGLIPKQVSIGNLIEIHGGGIVFMTRGCVAMENSDMDEIYNAANIGTPVTIVGSIGYPQEILSAIADI